MRKFGRTTPTIEKRVGHLHSGSSRILIARHDGLAQSLRRNHELLAQLAGTQKKYLFHRNYVVLLGFIICKPDRSRPQRQTSATDRTLAESPEYRFLFFCDTKIVFSRRILYLATIKLPEPMKYPKISLCFSVLWSTIAFSTVTAATAPCDTDLIHSITPNQRDKRGTT